MGRGAGEGREDENLSGEYQVQRDERRQEEKPGESEKINLSGRESGGQKMTGRAGKVIFDRLFRVRKIDAQGDEEKS